MSKPKFASLHGGLLVRKGEAAPSPGVVHLPYGGLHAVGLSVDEELVSRRDADEADALPPAAALAQQPAAPVTPLRPELAAPVHAATSAAMAPAAQPHAPTRPVAPAAPAAQAAPATPTIRRPVPQAAVAEPATVARPAPVPATKTLHATPKPAAAQTSHLPATRTAHAVAKPSAAAPQKQSSLSLKVDESVHLKLRLAAAQTQWSIKDIVIKAVDRYLDDLGQDELGCDLLPKR